MTVPLDPRLVDNLERPGGNISGVYDLLPLEQHLALIGEIASSPDEVKRNPGSFSKPTVSRTSSRASPMLIEHA